MARPTTLAAALTQLEHLSARLTLASSLFHQHTNRDLTSLLNASLPQTAYLFPSSTRTPAPSPPPPTPATALMVEAEDAASLKADAGSESENEAVDISPLVLKVLAIRKAVHVGEVEDGEAAVAELVAGLPVTDEQREQLRTWAGLT